MNPRLAAFVTLGMMALVAAAVQAQPRGRGGDAFRNGWNFSLEEGKAQARKTGKPLMVVVRCEP